MTEPLPPAPRGGAAVRPEDGDQGPDEVTDGDQEEDEEEEGR